MILCVLCENAPGAGGSHSEARGLNCLEVAEALGADQACRHNACSFCESRRPGLFVRNVTGAVEKCATQKRRSLIDEEP